MTAPRRENIPGYSANCRDSCNWEEAARALRVSPFYDGPVTLLADGGLRLARTAIEKGARGRP